MILLIVYLLAAVLSAAAALIPSRNVPRAPNGSPTAETVNGTYYGTYCSPYNQDFFLGIPFAKPPIQDLRFANPRHLDFSWEGALPATNYAFECIGYGGDQVGYEQSEDCLYLNVVRPSGYEKQKLPVAVWIHGGGFFDGGAVDRRYNLSFIVHNSVAIGKPIIAASIAYRLGPFGFLNGNDVVSARVRNLGDPTKVTIWGESPGASSVGLQLLAYNGRDDKLFRGGIMESGNPIFEGPLNGTEYYQPRYKALIDAAGCKEHSDSLRCLRDLPLFVLNNILNTTEFNSGWNPTIDDDFIARLGSEQLADGSFVHVPIISGANSDEGTAFSPVFIDTVDDFLYYLNTTTSVQYALPETLVQEFFTTYFNGGSDYLVPDSATLGDNVTIGDPYGTYWRRSAAYFGDEVFIAARRLTCQTWASANIPAYCYRFNAIPAGIPWPIEVTHFQEVAFVFNNLNGDGYAVNPFENKSESYTALSDLMSKSWASFLYDQDPNGWPGRDAAVPIWPVYETANPMNIVWDANVTSYAEPDTFRAEVIKLLNENWKLFLR